MGFGGEKWKTVGKTGGRGRRCGVTGFLGSYLHQMDAKGRLSLPAAFRRGSDAEAFVMVQAHDDALSLYPLGTWEQVQERLMELRERRPETRHYLLRVTAQAHEVVPDKQGRILVPDRLQESAGLDGEALVVGALDRIELWNPDRFEETTEGADEEFDGLARSVFA